MNSLIHNPRRTSWLGKRWRKFDLRHFDSDPGSQVVSANPGSDMATIEDKFSSLVGKHFYFLIEKGFQRCPSMIRGEDPRDKLIVQRFCRNSIAVDIQMSTVGTGIFAYVRKSITGVVAACSADRFRDVMNVESLPSSIVLPSELVVGRHKTLQDAYNQSPFVYQRRIKKHFEVGVEYLSQRLKEVLPRLVQDGG